jgi:hypothetical protein
VLVTSLWPCGAGMTGQTPCRRCRGLGAGTEGLGPDPDSRHATTIGGHTATCDNQDSWDEARRLIARGMAPNEVDDALACWHTASRY